MSVKRKIQILIIHFIAGTLCLLQPVLTDLWAVLILMYGTNKILLSRNETGYAHKFAIYIVGVELLFRNFNLSLPYEFGKYAVIYFLLLGRFVESTKQSTPHSLFIYILCLLPSIIFVDMGSLNENRKEILFNLSGPLELFVASIYFYNRRFTLSELKITSFWILCSLMVIIAAIYYEMPSLENISYTLGANYQTSGGFGPNQASSILGLGLLILSLGFIFDYSVTGNKLIDGGFIVLFAILGLLTFSRGGMISALVAVLAGYIISLIHNKSARSGKRVSFILFFMVLMFGAWEFVSEKSGNVLEKRYKGETMETETIGRYSVFTGRDKLAKIDYEIFKDNFLVGVGPGMATYMRVEYGYHNPAAAHTELTRLLAEHGVFGLVALLILIIFPIRKYLKNPRLRPLNKIVIAMFFLLAITTMMHAAMRTAMVGFFYGLALIDLREDEVVPAKDEEDEEEGKSAEDEEAEMVEPDKYIIPV